MSDPPPIRLAYLVSHYPRANHTYILREVRGLRALGFDVDVISVSGDDRPLSSLTDVEREERARVFVVKEQSVAHMIAAQLVTLARSPIAYLRGLAGAFALGRFDVRSVFFNCIYFAEAVIVGRRLAALGVTRLHSHFSTTVAILAARTFPISWSMTIHGHAEFTNPEALFIRQKVADAHFTVAISRFARSQLMSLTTHPHWDRIEVVPLGIDPAAFSPHTDVRSAGPFVVLFVGELRPVKGMPILLDALARLVRDGLDVTLRVVGDGPMLQSLERHAARLGLGDRVRFLGRLNQDAVRAEYMTADAFVLPSFAEGVPVVLMEAMAVELPCVATRITGIPELIRDGIDGLLVTPSDADELAAAVARLAGDAELRGRLGRSARERVVAEYNAATNVARLAEVMRRRYAAR